MEQYLYVGWRLTDEDLLRTPWLGFDHDVSREYDLVSFSDYPEHHGWSDQAVKDIYSSEVVVDRLAVTMLQSWIFFGFWEAVLQMKIKSSLYIFTARTKSMLGTRQLAKDIEDFKDNLFGPDMSNNLIEWDSEPGSGIMEWLQNMFQAHRKSTGLFLSKASVMVHRVTTTLDDLSTLLWALRQKPCAPEVKDLFDSVLNLASLNADAVGCVFKDLEADLDYKRRKVLDRRTFNQYRSALEGFQHPALYPSFYRVREDTKATEAMLVKRGWCPYVSRLLVAHRPGGGAYSLRDYAALVGPLEDASSDHTKCTGAACDADNIDEDQYEPVHRSQRCPLSRGGVCEDVRIKRHVSDIINTGDIPLVNIREILDYHSEQIKPEPVIKGWAKQLFSAVGQATAAKDGPNQPFVAFSHVWSHGIGSHAEAGLPRCQVEYLCELVKAYNQQYSVDLNYFWIDSLCIPKEKRIRRKAINSMNAIFNKAAATIIIDRGLQTLNLDSFSREEIYFYVTTSSWIRRLWTLPEAIGANHLVLSTENALLDIGTLADFIQNKLCRTPVEWACNDYMRFVIRPKASITLFDIAVMLRERTSSKKSDETLAIGPLIGVEASRLTKFGDDNTESRALEFWASLKTVSQSIVFMEGAKVTKEGFRWAPLSLMGQISFLNYDHDAKITARGLRATYYLINLHTPHKIDAGTDFLVFVQALLSYSTYKVEFSKSRQRRSVARDDLCITAIAAGSSFDDVDGQEIDVVLLSATGRAENEYRYLLRHQIQVYCPRWDESDKPRPGVPCKFNGLPVYCTTAMWKNTEIVIT